MIVNTLLVFGKIAAGVIGHSHALVADGVESLADLFSSLIVWRGLVVAAEPADQDHPYGHGKAEPIAAAFVSTMLLVAALWIGVTAVREILTPHTSPAWYTLLVLFVVIAVKETLFRTVFKEGESVESSAVKTDAWHHRSDAITSLAAAIGIGVALIGGPGYAAADDWAALVAAGIIGWNGYKLLRPALHELMDAAPDPSIETRVREVAGGVAEVTGVEKCITRKMGHRYFVDLHLEVDPQMTVDRAHLVAHNVKDEVTRQLAQVSDVLVHIEPAGLKEKLKNGAVRP
jgi:cation diffusion facilitator family transporter